MDLNKGYTTISGSDRVNQIPTKHNASMTEIEADMTTIESSVTTLEINNTGTNTGDETITTIKSKLGISTLSGSNTGDEDATSIKSKLGISTLSGSNTGDQTLPVKASGSEVNTGTDDAKFVTAKALVDGNILSQAWTSYNPTPTNFVKGAGGTLVGYYTRIGKTVIGRVHFKYGSGSSVSGGITFSLPVTSVSYTGTSATQRLGEGTILDSGTTEFFCFCLWNNTTTALLQVSNASGTYMGNTATSSTVPMTWTTNDEFYVSFIYEAA